MVGVVVIYQELRTHVYVSGNDLEPGEIQEVDMEQQAQELRTVFSDPTNFNVKVRNHCLYTGCAYLLTPFAPSIAPAILCLDSLV